jgi:hypothetical protein
MEILSRNLHILMLDKLQNPLIILIIPYLHFHVLKNSRNPWIASLPFALLCFLIPLARSDGIRCNPYLMAMFLGIALRVMDSASLETKDLTFRVYLECLVALKHPSKPKNKLDVGVENQNSYFYFQQLSALVSKFLIYSMIIKYFRNYRREWNPPQMVLYNPDDPYGLFHSYLLGWALCMLMDVLVSVFMHINSFIFKTPFVPIMNQPYLATSVRDFWSNRWNLIVKRGFKSSIFEPTLMLLGHHRPFSKNVPHLHLVIAGLMTFLFSGLLHEWTLLVMLDRDSAMEQFLFVIVHGIWTVIEVAVRKLVLRWSGIDLALTIPTEVQIIYTHSFLFLTSPLFMNPYIREELYFHVGFA